MRNLKNIFVKFTLAVMLTLVGATAVNFAAPVVRTASGANAAAIQAAVDQFRNDLGPLNPNVAMTFPTGRREINWDGVPDAFSAPNNLFVIASELFTFAFLLLPSLLFLDFSEIIPQ
jgi:hypothetical protein